MHMWVLGPLLDQTCQSALLQGYLVVDSEKDVEIGDPFRESKTDHGSLLHGYIGCFRVCQRCLTFYLVCTIKANGSIFL